jgi:hypothetical protein
MRRLLALLALVSSLAGIRTVLAQQAPVVRQSTSNEIMMSWRSNGFAPASYPGRVAAAGGGTVIILAEALVNGQPADLSRYEVRWYVNDELYETGFGLQAITVPVQRFHQDSLDARVEIIGAPFSETLKTISVPLTDPKSVVRPIANTRLVEGENVFVAVPYSFNVTRPADLVYRWSIDGQPPFANENPQQLVLTVEGPPDAVLVSLSITHPQNNEESARRSVRVLPAVTF